MPRTEKQPDYQEFIKALHLGVGSIPRKRIYVYIFISGQHGIMFPNYSSVKFTGFSPHNQVLWLIHQYQ